MRVGRDVTGLHPGEDGLGELVGVELAADVARPLASPQGLRDGVAQAVPQSAQTEMVEEQPTREQEAGRVGDAHARDVGSGAVNSFEERDLRADVGAGRDTQTADETRTQIRDNVPEHILGDDDAPLAGIPHERHTHRIDQHVVNADSAEVLHLCDRVERIMVEPAPDLVDVLFGHKRDVIVSVLEGVDEC